MRVLKVTAKDIKAALMMKHGQEIYAAEANLGSAGSRRIDFASIKPSWTKPIITGYEIKVSRRDFIQDEKYLEYLDYVNKLYIACPKGLIKKDEIPVKVGLIYYSEDYSDKFRTIKAPRFKEALANTDLLFYMLMWRYKINTENYLLFNTLDKNQKLEKYKKLVNDRHIMQHEVKNDFIKKIYDYQQEISDFKSRNYELEKYEEIVKEVLSFLLEQGIEAGYDKKRTILEHVKAGIGLYVAPEEAEYKLNAIERQVVNLRKMLGFNG